MNDELKSTRVCYGEDVLMMRVDDCIVFGNKDALRKMIAIHEELTALRDYYAETQHEPNEALAWDELKRMEGKPVWVDHQLHKGWLLVGHQVTPHMRIFVGAFSEQVPLYDDDLGKTWNAYRKERDD